MKLKVPIKWTVKLDSKDLREYLLSKDRLQPYAIIIGAKHAEWLEFGTPPYHNCTPLNIRRSDYKTATAYYKALYDVSEFYRSIFDWVRRKAGRNLPRNEQYAMAHRVYTNIAEHGLRARPFYRPAFYYLVEHMQDWWNNG